MSKVILVKDGKLNPKFHKLFPDYADYLIVDLDEFERKETLKVGDYLVFYIDSIKLLRRMEDVLNRFKGKSYIMHSVDKDLSMAMKTMALEGYSIITDLKLLFEKKEEATGFDAKKYVGGKVLSVYGQPEFAIALAHYMGEHCDKSVLLVDGDRMNPVIHHRTTRVFKTDFEAFMDNYPTMIGKLEKWGTVDFVKGIDYLGNFEYFSEQALMRMLEIYREVYDIVIINNNMCIYDAYTVISMIKSDVNLFPIKTYMTNLKALESKIEFLSERQNVRKDRCWLISFDHGKNNLNEYYTYHYSSINYLGKVRLGRDCSSKPLTDTRIPHKKTQQDLRKIIKQLRLLRGEQ